ncbi:hypothetical protein ACFL5V_11865 [Fibrobacterota bacterium]
MKHKTIIRNIITGMSVLSLMACMETTSVNETADDPEGLEAQVGTLVFNSLNQSGDLGTTLAIADGAPGLNKSTGLSQVNQAGLAGLAKAAAGGNCLTDTSLDLSDTADGIAVFQVVTECDGFRQTETAWANWDDKAKDDIGENENIRSFKYEKEEASGKVETAMFTDLDGDGIANGDAVYNGQVRLEMTSSDPSGITEHSIIDVDAGPDRNFDAEDDNLILGLSWEKTSNGAVIGSAAFIDADEDGILAGPGLTSLVDLELFEAGNPLKPLVASSRLNLSPDDVDGRLLAISGEEIFKNGRVNRLEVTDAQGDVIIDPGDIATVRITSDYPVDGEDLHSELVLVIGVGSGLQDESDNLIYELHATHEKRFGPIALEEFHFVTEEPFMEGQEPTSGTVEALVEYRNGDLVTVSGTFSEGLLQATITGPDGTLTVTWDADGEQVEENS